MHTVTEEMTDHGRNETKRRMLSWRAPTSLCRGDVSDRPLSLDTLIRLSRDVSLLAPTSLSSRMGREAGCPGCSRAALPCPGPVLV